MHVGDDAGVRVIVAGDVDQELDGALMVEQYLQARSPGSGPAARLGAVAFPPLRFQSQCLPELPLRGFIPPGLLGPSRGQYGAQANVGGDPDPSMTQPRATCSMRSASSTV